MKYFKTFEERLSDRVVSAQDLVDNTDTADLLEIEGIYKELFGQPSKTFDMCISGAPASGKTTFLLKFAYYLAAKFGKTLYISSEEFGSVTLVNKLKDMFPDKDDFNLPKNLFFAKGMTDLTDYKFVIIDSATDIGVDIDDYKEVSDIYENTSFIIVLQQTKSGDYRGSKEWSHEVEIFAELEEGKIYVTKNRYGVYGAYDFFNKEEIENTMIDKKDE